MSPLSDMHIANIFSQSVSTLLVHIHRDRRSQYPIFQYAVSFRININDYRDMVTCLCNWNKVK